MEFTGTQKIAVILLALGDKFASDVFNRMTRSEITNISRAIMELDSVSKEEVEDSQTVKDRVQRTREIQHKRFVKENIRANADIGPRELEKYCKLSSACEDILKQSFESLKLSARARSRIIKVARTIADLAEKEDIEERHLLEAISYRSYDNLRG